MAIALFPHLDGETLGSNFGRYGEFIGAESTLAIRRRLFGYPCKPDTRLPSGMNHLAEQTRDYWNLDAEQIIKRGTEFYYATATMSVTRRESMLSDLLKQPGSRTLRRSVGGWGAERVAKFRYCEDCLAQWRESGMPAHWMVDHQLPGVYVCPVHARMLKVAKRGIPQNLTDSTVTALKDVNDEDILARVSRSEMVAFSDVAKLSAHCRIASGSVPSLATYRELLRTAGYAWLTGGVDIRALTASMVEHFGNEYCQSSGLSLKRLATWLKNIEGDAPDGESSHPFVFISVMSMLNARCVSPGTFAPAVRIDAAEIAKVPTEDIRGGSRPGRVGLQCKGFLHRANDVWQLSLSSCNPGELVCSCGVTYRTSEVGRDVDVGMRVVTYGERYRDLVSKRFADNINVGCTTQFPSVNPGLPRWLRSCGFFRPSGLSAEAIQELRDRWSSVVKSARLDRRITSSYKIDSQLYRELYKCDREWIKEFNRNSRGRTLNYN
ncbi:TnsD family Tn7-like transposition protein [Paraburkholderia tropica]|uniref:TnsD family Tn7-like transposition protein n=1 Tax=Paraburkholderia tropica TaxID=92647 RepID=UPI00158FFE24|nr:TniQ family protein [Paraburkholderia tropica]